MSHRLRVPLVACPTSAPRRTEALVGKPPVAPGARPRRPARCRPSGAEGNLPDRHSPIATRLVGGSGTLALAELPVVPRQRREGRGAADLEVTLADVAPRVVPHADA